MLVSRIASPGLARFHFIPRMDTLTISVGASGVARELAQLNHKIFLLRPWRMVSRMIEGTMRKSHTTVSFNFLVHKPQKVNSRTKMEKCGIH